MHPAARHSDAAPRWAGEGGFTIVEVMAAIVVFTIGVLGTVSLLENSFASTNRTTAREQGTNLARDLVERVRQLPYADTATTKAPAKLRSLLPASDNAGTLDDTTFTVTRRNVTYSVTVTACSIDDPADGGGTGIDDSTGSTGVAFCMPATSGSGSGPGAGALQPAISIPTVLGIPVSLSAGGSLLETVCDAAALNSTLSTQLLDLVKPIAPVTACPGAAGSTVGYDASPDDMRYVRFDVSWTRAGRPGDVSQTTLIPNPDQT